MALEAVSTAGSLAAIVERHLEQDTVAGEALARGVVNLRALARWLIDRHDLDATEDAVLSALRRHRRGPEGGPFDAANAVLARSHVNMRSRICSLRLPKNHAVQEALPAVFQAVDFSKGEILRVLQSETGIRVLIDESNLPQVEAILGGHIESVRMRLTEIGVMLPEEAVDTPGIIGAICTTLALHRISIVEAVCGFREQLVFVNEPEALRAVQALMPLVEQPKRPARAPTT